MGVNVRESDSGGELVITSTRVGALEARVSELENKLEAQNSYMAHALGGVQMVREELKSVLRVEIQKIINKYEGVQ